MFPALLLLCCSGPAPEVTFVVDDDDVVMHLSRGNPARVKVYAPGVPLEGETDEKSGRGRLFLPKVGRFWVGITIAGKECDLIPLERDGDKLTPERVLLTFGSRPCCKVPARPRPDQAAPEEPEEEADWLLAGLALGGGACVLAALLVGVFRLRGPA